MQSILPLRSGEKSSRFRKQGSPMKSPWIPRALRYAPALDPSIQAGPPRPKLALLINPFYPKDPHASFGKHVLTPSLALTSIAGATPLEWDVVYWDENLLQGPPPWEPFPEVVGITVHLTFADRAYALAAWYRKRGAKVILGGLHVLSCPEEVAPHADALAIGEGGLVKSWSCTSCAFIPISLRPFPPLRILMLPFLNLAPRSVSTPTELPLDPWMWTLV